MRICLIIATLLFSANALSEGAVVLVTAISSPVTSVPTVDLRKLYLGYTTVTDTGAVPIINKSNRDLYSYFLKSVLYMNAKDYENGLKSNSAEGKTHPLVFEDSDAVVGFMSRRSGAITFMWARTAALYSNLKVLKTLWVDTEVPVSIPSPAPHLTAEK